MRTMAAAFLFSVLTMGPAVAGDLTVTVEGVKNVSGSVMGALYDKKASFMNQAQARQLFKTKAVVGQVEFVVHDLPAGKYAFAIFHDANGNGKIDKNMFGAPLEGFGFSNNVQGAAGPPEFEQAAFDFNGQNQSMSIRLNY